MVSKSSKLQPAIRFKFWLDQALQDGMRYQHSFFQRLHTLDGDERLRIYVLADRLARQGADILVTHDQDTCSLWINLKYRDAAYASRQSAIRQSAITKLPSDLSVNTSQPA